MNDKILLLGNGFDLYHKLPTRYDCFLHTVDFLIKYYDESMQTVGSIFGDKRLQEMDSFISDSYTSYKSGYDTENIIGTEIKSLIELASKNIWFTYLLSTYNMALRWIDFEKEISYVIEVFRFFLENTNGTIFDIDDDDEYDITISKFDFFYTNSFGGECDLEVLPEYTIDIPYGSGIQKINKPEIIATLASSLRELAEILKTYLDIFVDRPLTNLTQNKLIHIHPLFKNAKCIFTLNYTYTYEKIYAPSSDIHHVHGDINGNIVLGVDSDENDELIDMDTSFIALKKYFQRVLYKTDETYLQQLLNMSNWARYNSRISLWVVGHSLDSTDQEIIKDLFNQASEIIIYYHNESAINDYIRNLIEIYGKKAFDQLRIEKHLQFLPLEPY